jgi:hypothetical protein
MDTEDFLTRVLPAQGYYSAVVINNEGPVGQRFVDSPDRLAALTKRLSALGANVYYAVSSFRDASSRKQTNVLYTKSFFIDVDCGPGKPFADWRAGLVALGKFVSDNSLPKPLIVSSGNGLHVYWVLEEPLAPEEWTPLADSLKAMMPRDRDTGVILFDPAVPADSARVLRAPGTVNPKGGKTVRVLLDAPDIPVEVMRAALGNPAPMRGIVQPPRSSLLDNMAVTKDFPPSDADAVVSKCGQIGWAVANQGDVSEPFWYALLGVAASCKDPEQVAIAWSKDHPGYDEDKTLRKLAQWRAKATGPTTCTKFGDLRPEGCKKCRFKDARIGSPASLGLQYESVPVDEDAPDDASKVPLPKHYTRSKSGMKLNIDGTFIDVCNFDIYPLSYGRDELLGYETVRFRWKRPHVGWQVLSFRQAYLTQQAIREFANTIADQGIVLYNKGQTENFQNMLRAYMDELRNLRSVTNLYSSMGWKDSNTQFMLGDTLIRQDESGTVVRDNAVVSSIIQRTSDALYSTSGTKEEWAAFTSLLEKANMPIHMFALCVSFSAPLYQFSGIKGLTINLHGPTGAGKTLAQMWQQSIWGEPSKLHYAAKFTQNALFARMGMYNNLPVTIDETTMLPPKEVGDFLYWVSQGRDKARLSRTTEERDHKTWATVVTTSANRSMTSMLAATGLESDAQMARLLEISMSPHRLFTKDTKAGKHIYDFITTHYGEVGAVFVEYLVGLGNQGVRAVIADHHSRFFKKYNCKFSGSERFWETCIMLADLAGELATQQGLIQFDHTKGIEAVLKQLGVMRKVVAENSVDAFDLLSEYLNEFASTTLQVIHNGNTKPFVDITRLPRGEVHIRYDLYGPKGSTTGPFDSGTVLLDRKHFRQWLSKRGMDYRAVVREFADQGANATPLNDKAYLGKDSPIKIGQQYVIGVNLKHPRLIGILRDADSAALAAEIAQLNVVPIRKP